MSSGCRSLASCPEAAGSLASWWLHHWLFGRLGERSPSADLGGRSGRVLAITVGHSPRTATARGPRRPARPVFACGMLMRGRRMRLRLLAARVATSRSYIIFHIMHFALCPRQNAHSCSGAVVFVHTSRASMRRYTVMSSLLLGTVEIRYNSIGRRLAITVSQGCISRFSLGVRVSPDD